MGSTGNNNSGFNSRQYKTTLQDVENKIRPDKTETLVVIASDGTILVNKNEGKTSEVSITPDELALMKGATVTHNHPSGTTFSWQDIATLEKSQAHEERAVGSNGITYSLVAGPNATINGDFAFAYYTAEHKYMSDVVDAIWANSAQTQVDADRCNKMVADYKKQWLKGNAKKFGYKYTERNTKK